MASRFDQFAIKTAHRTPEGFLVDTPVVTRTGIFEYADPSMPGGIRRELRRPEEVFAPEHLNSMRGKPITFGHVTGLESGRVDSVIGLDGKPWRSIGAVLAEGRKDEDPSQVVADLSVHHPEVVDKHNLRELSLGYTLDYDATPGIWEGQRYDGEQKNLRVTHVAFVKRGRAGVARINLDSAEDVPFAEATEDSRMPQVRLDSGLSYEAAPEVIQELASYRTRAEKDKARADAAEAARDAATAKADALTAKAGADAAKMRADMRSEIRARMDMEDTASSMKIETRSDMSDKDLRIAIIRKVNGDGIDLAQKSDAYIEAAYDIAVSQTKSNARSDAAVQQLAGGMGDMSKQPVDQGDPEKVRNDAMDQRDKRLTEGWKNVQGAS